MPFFESASEYRINGGSYQDMRGDINEHHQNNSVRVDGQGNAVTYNHGSQQNGSGSNITNNCSGSMTIIGQGDNARIHLSSLDFQGNNGFFQMPPYPQVHVSMPQNDPGYAAFPYSHQGSPYFDPRMGQPQQFVPEQTMYQSNISYVNQFPTAHAHPPSTANYTAGPINMAGTQNPSSWGEPPGTTRSTVPTEHPVDFSSYYNPAAPSSSSQPMMPMPSPAQASAPLQIPSSVPVPEPLPARAPPPAQAPAQTYIQMPVHPQSPGPDLNTTSPVAPPSTIQFPNSPQERTITPSTSHSSVRYARTEVHPSPSDSSQDAAHWNSTTPYSHRAVYQIHAHETLHTTPRQDEVPAPHSATSSNPIVERRSERVSSPSPSHRSSSVQQPSETEAPQSPQKLQLDTFSPPSNQIASSSAASASTPVAVRSPTPQEDRVSAYPSEKAIRGIHEVELSLESMPPPAYSLEAETPFQTEEISQKPTSVINPPSNTGLENQENRYSPSRTEVERQEEDYSMPDIILPKKKKKKKSWSVVELFMRRSRKNTKPAIEL